MTAYRVLYGDGEGLEGLHLDAGEFQSVNEAVAYAIDRFSYTKWQIVIVVEWDARVKP